MDRHGQFKCDYAADESAAHVHLIVTSPPYWGLRDYKIPSSIWGGDPDCLHKWGESEKHKNPTRHGKRSTNGKHSAVPLDVVTPSTRGSFCSCCGAWRGAFGLEPTSELYIEHAVAIFREARRVLRRDGTLWVNLGDSYSNESKWGGSSGGKNSTSARGGYQGQRVKRGNRPSLNGRGEKQVASPEVEVDRDPARKAGDLVGIPWRVVLALQADGWYLRRDNIWFKPNPMPESVSGWRWERHRVKAGVRKANGRKPSGWDTASGTSHHDSDGRFNDNQIEAVMIDCPGCEKCALNIGLILRKGNWRCTTSHEYVFQFSRSANYFCDAEAARERSSGTAHSRGHGVNPKACGKNSRMRVDRDPEHQTKSQFRHKQNVSFSAAVRGITANGITANRNLRSVWKISTKPYSGAHFATFPPALVRPIIKAASPLRCCRECGGPFAPVVERGEANKQQQRACGGDVDGHYNGTATKEFALHGAQDASAVKTRILAGMVEKTVVGYRPTCSCDDTGDLGVPAVVLDMFAGSGTVGQVSLEVGRAAVLIEISAAYVPLIRKRCEVMAPLGL